MDTPRASNIRPAASVLVLRDGPRGVEVLLMRRPERGDNDFRSGMCVFPGGVLDRSDAQTRALCFGLDDAAASARLGVPGGGLDYFIAALRETFEEVGLLFACLPGGEPIDMAAHADTLRDWRSRLHRGEADIAQFCRAMDWRLDLRDTAYFAHWLTPVIRPKRFDTRFFLRVAPAGQTAMPDMGEALELMWLRPHEALDPQRGLKLLNVTQKVLHSIAGWTSARSGFDQAFALRGVRRIFPRMALGRDGPRFVVDGDAAYDEVARLDPDGRGDARCDLSPGDVTQLSPRLWRVSGVARNAYLVSDTARAEAAIIDADVADTAQLQALLLLATMPVQWLLFTGIDNARRAALQTYWPKALGADQALADRRLKIGADCNLSRADDAAHAKGWVLEEDAIGLGAIEGGRGLRWLAGPQGFMRCLSTG